MEYRCIRARAQELSDKTGEDFARCLIVLRLVDSGVFDRIAESMRRVFDAAVRAVECLAESFLERSEEIERIIKKCSEVVESKVEFQIIEDRGVDTPTRRFPGRRYRCCNGEIKNHVGRSHRYSFGRVKKSFNRVRM